MGDVEKALGQLASYLNAMDPRTLYAFVGIGIFLVLVATIAGLRTRREAQPQHAPPSETYEQITAPAELPPPPPVLPPSPPSAADRQIAEMIETSEMTGFGNFCVFLMVVTWFISAAVFISAKGALQEVVGVLIWIGGNTMFGIGALLNRQRRYKFYRP
jgi:hypothetical protein